MTRLKKLDEIKNWTQENILPRFVILGVIIGFAACVALGHFFAGKNIFQNFHRLHPYISMDTQFLPTFSELYQLAKSKIEQGKTLVIVGGDSVFNGQGQTVDKLWSDRLQKELGDKYTVINISFRGGRVFEGAYWIFEALSKEQHDVIFIANAFGAVVGAPFGNTPYRYMFWDGMYKGYLRPFTDRDEFIKMYPDLLVDQYNKPLDELFLCMKLDSVLYFRDLWNVVSYYLFSSVWTEGTAKDPLAPRVLFPDKIPVSDTVNVHNSDKKLWMSTVEKYSMPYVEIVNGQLQLNQKSWREFDILTNCGTLPELRSKILLVSVNVCPLYFNKLNSLEKERHMMVLNKSIEGYKEKGFNTMVIDNLADDDYIDAVHLDPDGGNKVASQVAARIKEIKQNIGNIGQK